LVAKCFKRGGEIAVYRLHNGPIIFIKI